MKMPVVFFLVAGVILLQSPSALGAEKAPLITDLGLGTETVIVNDRGQVAFTRTTINGSGYEAVLWDSGVLTKIGVLPGDNQSWVAAMNDRGQVIGKSVGRCFAQGFLWQNGVLSPLGECASWASGINDRGQIVGTTLITSPVVWQDGGTGVKLNIPSDGSGVTLSGINDRGQIVGGRGVAGHTRPFLWDKGQVTDLGLLPGASNCSATAINKHSQVIGWCLTSTGPLRSFLWENGVMTPLAHDSGVLGSKAASINNKGDIVGDAYGADFQVRAVLWREGKMIDLTKLVSSSWFFAWASSINNHGQIAGVGRPTAETGFHAFVLDLR